MICVVCSCWFVVVVRFVWSVIVVRGLMIFVGMFVFVSCCFLLVLILLLVRSVNGFLCVMSSRLVRIVMVVKVCFVVCVVVVLFEDGCSVIVLGFGILCFVIVVVIGG